METICIDLVNTKTEDDDYQREDTKPGILYDSTIVQNNVPEATKGENDNENFDIFKNEFKNERGDDSESETVECKRISAEHEVLNVHKTAKSVKIQSENEEHQNDKEKFSVKKLQGNLENVFDVAQRKHAANKNESVKRGEKSFQCDICSKIFQYNSKLKEHNRTHSGEKPFECNTCNKAFSDSGTLKKHERIHNGDKPFECKICKKTFSQSSNLKTHERIHSSEKPFEYKTCKQSFSQSSILRKHERIHTGEIYFGMQNLQEIIFNIREPQSP